MQYALVVLLILLGGTQQPAPPAQGPPGIPEAMRLQPTDPLGALKILEGVTAREPHNGRAWRLLGSALQQAEQFDRAIDAYRRALAIGPDPTATYNIGISYLRKKDVDSAFEWLSKARAAKYDMTQMLVDTSLEPLRSDPRYLALVPTKADFAKPFVEDTTILAEWIGEAANDQFGWIARGAGDLDKDGVPDFVTCAPFKGDAARPSGRIYAYSTKSRKLLWKADGAPGDQLGITLETAGDVNADGTPDVVATGGGKANVFSGTDGKVLLSLASPGAQPILAASTAGDVDRDGHADIIAGANPRPPSGPPPAGQPSPPVPGNVYVFSGKDGKVLLTLEGERPGDRFGSAVAGHADKAGMLLLVGAPRAGARSSGRMHAYTSLSSKPAFIVESDETGGALGAMFVAVVGDVDRDGVADAYVSDFGNRAKGPATGRVYVHSGKDGSRLLVLTGEGPGEALGTSASAAGDLDGDGHADLAVGAWQYGGAAMSGGRIYVYSGKDGRLLRTITGQVPGDTLGFDSVGIGDTDGDGASELLVTSAYSAVNGYRSGRVFLLSSGIRR